MKQASVIRLSNLVWKKIQVGLRLTAKLLLKSQSISIDNSNSESDVADSQIDLYATLTYEFFNFDLRIIQMSLLSQNFKYGDRFLLIRHSFKFITAP